MSTFIQDKHALYTQILRLWSSFDEMREKHGVDALTDADFDLWISVTQHPACRQQLHPEQLGKDNK